ncbi:nucleoside recognition domain-containing protein [Limnochorda pilosa]|uniref:Nucleoside recognition protein n=1 Tax=Limnochorda pilosa TaxID=1555112 RepID=A0A0K2SHP4_LIMPI|nr:nucleoside recognition domain-containing protein [Limnochorda pilosa]BAS26610.1 nucleoside recognition protein [Limnochorda pilosa]
MVNWLWAAMVLSGFAMGLGRGMGASLTQTFFTQAAAGFQAGLQVMIYIILWYGLSRIAERAGVLDVLARLIAPLVRPFFPEVPKGHPAFSPMTLNLAANFLGLANAATPFGLKTMEELNRLNPRPGEATPAMITFLAMNSAAIGLIPSTAIALRAAAGAANPADIVVPSIVATAIPLAVVLVVDWIIRRGGVLRPAPALRWRGGRPWRAG